MSRPSMFPQPDPLTAATAALAEAARALGDAARALADLARTPAAPPPPPVDGSAELLTITAAARRLGVSRDTVYALLAQGQLPVVRVGTQRRIPAGALARLGQQQEENAR